MHPLAVACAFQQVQLARLAGELVKTMSLLGRVEVVRGSVRKEERARSDPADQVLNREAKQLLAGMTGDREPIGGILVELCVDVGQRRAAEADELEGRDQGRAAKAAALDAVSLEPLHEPGPGGVVVQGACGAV